MYSTGSIAARIGILTAFILFLVIGVLTVFKPKVITPIPEDKSAIKIIFISPTKSQPDTNTQDVQTNKSTLSRPPG